jgi:hypothetical protein
MYCPQHSTGMAPLFRMVVLWTWDGKSQREEGGRREQGSGRNPRALVFRSHEVT